MSWTFASDAIPKAYFGSTEFGLHFAKPNLEVRGRTRPMADMADACVAQDFEQLLRHGASLMLAAILAGAAYFVVAHATQSVGALLATPLIAATALIVLRTLVLTMQDARAIVLRFDTPPKRQKLFLRNRDAYPAFLLLSSVLKNIQEERYD